MSITLEERAKWRERMKSEDPNQAHIFFAFRLLDALDAAEDRAGKAEAGKETAFIQGLSAAIYAATSHDNDLGYLDRIAEELGYESAKAVAEAAGDDCFLDFIQRQEADSRAKTA